jgi:hypothetical protein
MARSHLKITKPNKEHIEQCMAEQTFSRILEETPRPGGQQDRWEYLDRVHVDEAARARQAKYLLGAAGRSAIEVLNTHSSRVALAILPDADGEIEFGPDEARFKSAVEERATIAAQSLSKAAGEAARVAASIAAKELRTFEELSALYAAPEEVEQLQNILSMCRRQAFEYESPAGRISFGGRPEMPRALPGANKATVWTKASGTGLIMKPNGDVSFCVGTYELSVSSGPFPADFNDDITVKLATLDDAMTLWLLKTADTQFLTVKAQLGFDYVFESKRFELRLEAVLNAKEIVEHCRHPRDVAQQYFGQSSLLQES